MAGISMRGNNKGLTAKLNLWAMKEYLPELNASRARLWIKGKITNAETKQSKMFHDAGELITILGKWNREKYKQLRKGKGRR